MLTGVLNILLRGNSSFASVLGPRGYHSHFTKRPGLHFGKTTRIKVAFLSRTVVPICCGYTTFEEFSRTKVGVFPLGQTQMLC
ncbi:unnamed protein product [Calypogeia fissa]